MRCSTRVDATTVDTEALPDWLERRLQHRLALLSEDGVVRRIHERDGSLWPGDPLDNAARLGWLRPEEPDAVQDIADFASRAWETGYTSAVLIGMGGSSQAAATFAALARMRRLPGLSLTMAGSTVPAAIRDVEAAIEPGRTLFIVSSKSGSTLETRALLDYFWYAHSDPSAWIAITDPGTGLDDLANERRFARVFHGHEDIGGRFSALSAFGLVPAALVGLDVAALLHSAGEMHSRLKAGPETNPGARLGAILAECVLAGHDVLTLLPDERLRSFGGWLTQLIAESTGKDGTGLLPVTGELLGDPSVYGKNRLFASLDVAADDGALHRLATAGYPVLHCPVETDHGLPGEMLRWAFATAVAGHILGINPFDQPDVEGAKQAAQALLDGRLEPRPLSDLPGTLSAVTGDSYVALHAYLPDREEVNARLHRVQLTLRDRFHVPVTVEYGPELLHSTGQYHKGGPPRGIIVQVLEPDTEDIPVPGRAAADGSPLTFGAIKQAQADADALMLREHGQRVTRSSLTGLEAIADDARRLG